MRHLYLLLFLTSCASAPIVESCPELPPQQTQAIPEIQPTDIQSITWLKCGESFCLSEQDFKINILNLVEINRYIEAQKVIIEDIKDGGK